MQLKVSCLKLIRKTSNFSWLHSSIFRTLLEPTYNFRTLGRLKSNTELQFFSGKCQPSVILLTLCSHDCYKHRKIKLYHHKFSDFSLTSAVRTLLKCRNYLCSNRFEDYDQILKINSTYVLNQWDKISHTFCRNVISSSKIAVFSLRHLCNTQRMHQQQLNSINYYTKMRWASTSTQIMQQEALQMQREHATRHKYKISHLKRLAIGEWPSTTLKVITIAAIR